MNGYNELFLSIDDNFKLSVVGGNIITTLLNNIIISFVNNKLFVFPCV